LLSLLQYFAINFGTVALVRSDINKPVENYQIPFRQNVARSNMNGRIPVLKPLRL